MAIAAGISKKLVALKQSALGTKATAGGAAITFPRVSSTIDMDKASYASKELRASRQISDMRHGLRSVAGTINGELSVGTYSAFMSSVLRAAWAAVVTSGALTNVTAAVTTGSAGTFTRAAGSFLTDGFKAGMVVRWAGWATTGVPNNAHNFLITACTATVMTVVALDAVAVGAKASGDSVTATSAGKSLSVPVTGHTADYWTIEHNFPDITQSEQFTDCVLASMDVKLPATGMATVSFPVVGLNMDTSTAPFFTTPTDAVGGSKLAAVNGAVYVAGVAVAYITGLDIKINGQATSAGAVVGSNVAPDISVGSVDITGSMTVLFKDAVMRDYFVNETEVAIIAAFTTANTATADFMSFIMPRVKVAGAKKTDGEKSLVMTMPFTALENTAGGTGTSSIATTLTIQDNLAA